MLPRPLQEGAMSESGEVAVVTYFGIDGACAAAMALLRWPEAELVPTSAARVGQAFDGLLRRHHALSEVHVCGVGVHCPWEDLARPARGLASHGVRIFWHCGRGYLHAQRDAFAEFSAPAFADAGSNTEAVRLHLGLGGGIALALADLAGHDPNVEKGWRRPSEEQAFWMDLVNAAIADYFKYQDEAAFPEAVRRLSLMRPDEADRRRVAVFRKSGFRHVLWGRSAAMGRLRETVRRCAEADEPVLVTGESGVGKEYVAHLVHQRSRRATGPFVAVNCALFAGNGALANSTLFGHVKGAFTGALHDRDGAFVSADAGMLFLDELAELPPEVQAKLLRVIEDGWVTPEGADRPRQVDVRIIGATNQDLAGQVRAGAFRADLFHRLDVLQVRVPPLREHIEDVDAIVEQVLPTLRSGTKLEARAMQALRAYDWPGNVRQLIKVLKRSLYLDQPVDAVIAEERRLGSLEPACELWPASAADVRPIREVQRAYAARAFELNSGNYAATARALGIAVNTLRAYLATE
jgi:DNA-binding NtrC family response regulator